METRWVKVREDEVVLRGKLKGIKGERILGGASRLYGGSWSWHLIPFWAYGELPSSRKGRSPIYPKILSGSSETLEGAMKEAEDLIDMLGEEE